FGETLGIMDFVKVALSRQIGTGVTVDQPVGPGAFHALDGCAADGRGGRCSRLRTPPRIGRAGGRNLDHRAPSSRLSPSSSLWQAAEWPGPTPRVSGTSVRHAGTASGQRVWNLQPGGGFSGDGRSPCRRTRPRARFAPISGTADRRLWV